MRRLADRLLQVAGRQPRVEIVQQRPVVNEGSSPAPLGVSGDLSSFEHEIRSSGNQKARQIERRRNRLKDELKTGAHISEPGPRNQG
jgi:hypothetical protein